MQYYSTNANERENPLGSSLSFASGIDWILGRVYELLCLTIKNVCISILRCEFEYPF